MPILTLSLSLTLIPFSTFCSTREKLSVSSTSLATAQLTNMELPVLLTRLRVVDQYRVTSGLTFFTRSSLFTTFWQRRSLPLLVGTASPFKLDRLDGR
ncbi:hypothetical protein AZE42_05521 [Rhizopogon vesiculosus]|uniref:Secreted protein n=1 Tax=Rhizopogon vesiculosus TaxID=180088 RepID=A0A1J8PMT4_9AGAM|nr:hypothetical protein AZE42_05521 [Rhizopogon vesiculosus]